MKETRRCDAGKKKTIGFWPRPEYLPQNLRDAGKKKLQGLAADGLFAAKR
jgi:hypothetical protein